MNETKSFREIRRVSEREIAIALVLEFAESRQVAFSLLGFYDDDADFISAVAYRLLLNDDQKFKNKITKVTRRLVRYGVLVSRMGGTSKEYFGEPAKQRSYWLEAGKVHLLRRGKTDYTMSPEGEAEFLLRRAYPDPER